MLGLVFMGMVRSFPPYHTAGVSLGNASPNIGRPLRDCSREASSWMTSQCSTMTPPSIRRMSAAIQLTGAPNPENRPWTMTISPSATIIPAWYFSVAGRLLMRSNRPSRPGAMCHDQGGARVGNRPAGRDDRDAPAGRGHGDGMVGTGDLHWSAQGL